MPGPDKGRNARARAARRRMAAQARRRPMSSGLLLWGALAIAALWLVSTRLAKKEEPARPPSEYRNMCSTVLSAAKALEPRLAATTLSAEDPTVLSPGPPPRIRCPLTTATGDLGHVIADVNCRDPFNNRCVEVTSATLDGRTVLNQAYRPTRGAVGVRPDGADAVAPLPVPLPDPVAPEEQVAPLAPAPLPAQPVEPAPADPTPTDANASGLG